MRQLNPLIFEMASKLSYLLTTWCLNAQGSPLFRRAGAAFNETGEQWLHSNLRGRINQAIDVGANYGDYLSLIKKYNPNARIVAIEAVPEFAQKIKSLHPEAELIQSAASNICGEEIAIFQKGGGANADPSRGNSSKLFKQHNIATVTIDEVSSKKDIKPDFIKIDTDGYDLKVLEGSLATLQKYSPVVQIECSRFWRFTGSDPSKIFDICKSIGYKVYVLRKKGIYELRSPGPLYGSF
ncbi:FkbM family methyltransferase [Synechococcus sp. TAK9802]|uniref:FkbM family methyltransferase n=1 Tax=Synechococcus sp. TAK9802 TaxID=1442558 RepID=UPI001648F940|nr:FkbM family methyltransferase [Synechococcus sp. TAK9802]QNI62787.1 S-adenosyl-L-methionine-dependent methyltransferase [Synechococcus sp. TAK9802]